MVCWRNIVFKPETVDRIHKYAGLSPFRILQFSSADCSGSPLKQVPGFLRSQAWLSNCRAQRKQTSELE